MNRAACLAPLLSLALLACDHPAPLATLEAGPAPPATNAPPEASAPSPAPRATARAMPPRPVPTSSPTVRVTMPIQVQLQAIQYMQAMQAPQPSDAPADPTYAKSIAASLRAVGKTDVVEDGRRIDIAMARSCEATTPKQAIAQHTSASLMALLSHGVLVVRCADREVQCLQSTRDESDVLCTHK